MKDNRISAITEEKCQTILALKANNYHLSAQQSFIYRRLEKHEVYNSHETFSYCNNLSKYKLYLVLYFFQFWNNYYKFISLIILIYKFEIIFPMAANTI